MSPATQEAWYRETARAGHATWSSIYQWDDKPEVLSVSYNEPLRFGDGRLRGVIGVDVILTQLSKRLAEIWGGRAGLVLITERNGMVVASSKGSPFQSRPGQTPERLRINQSLDPLEREVAQLLFLPGPTGGLRLNQELVHRSSRKIGRAHV